MHQRVWFLKQIIMKKILTILLTLMSLSVFSQIQYIPADTIGGDSILYQKVVTEVTPNGNIVTTQYNQLKSKSAIDFELRIAIERLYKSLSNSIFKDAEAFFNNESDLQQLLTLKSAAGREFFAEQNSLYRDRFIGQWEFYDSYNSNPITINCVDNNGELEFRTGSDAKIADIDIETVSSMVVTFMADVPGTAYDKLNNVSGRFGYGKGKKQIKGNLFTAVLQTSEGPDAVIFKKL